MVIHIRNRLYNTETAKMIGKWEINDKGKEDSQFAQETLFRKKTGEYFLLCEGGADSVHSSRDKDGRKIKGEFIQLISFDEAKQWMEKHLDFEKLITDNNNKKLYQKNKEIPISLKLSKEVHTKLQNYRSQFGISYRDILSILIMDGQEILESKSEVVRK